MRDPTSPPPALANETEEFQCDSAQELSTAYWKTLVHVARGKQETQLGLPEFATLRRINLIHISSELAVIKTTIDQAGSANGDIMKRLRTTLHDYTEAIRDCEYMRSLGKMSEEAARDWRHELEGRFEEITKPKLGIWPYDTTYLTLDRPISQETDSVREFLRKTLPRRLAWPLDERKDRRVDYQEGKPPTSYSSFVDRLARFVIATGAGLSVIVPMIIMFLNSSRTKSLITVSVAVLLFAVVLSFGFAANTQHTVVATATYAAVLVVFVGTS